MSRTLILVLGPDHEAPVAWALGSGEQGRIDARGRRENGAALAELCPEDVERVVALVPGSEVMVRRVHLPPGRDVRAALPFLLEDDLAVDLDTVHFALGRAETAGPRLVAAVDRTRMQAWRDMLRPIDGPDVVLMPDFLALPAPARGMALYELDGRIAAVSPEGGFAVEPDLVPHLLSQEAGSEDPVLLHTSDPGRLAPPDGWGSRETVVQPAPDENGLFLMALQRAEDKPALNLLQGAFARPRKWAAGFGPWRQAAALAAAAVFALLGLSVAEAVRYDTLADRLHERADAVFREAFPEVKRVVNARAQMKARLSELRAGSSDGYLRLTGILFESLEPLTNIELVALRYDGSQEILTASISYSSYPDMEALKAAVSDRGGRIEEGSSRQDGGWTVGDVTLRAGR